MVVLGQSLTWFGQQVFRIGLDFQDEPCLPWRIYVIRPFAGAPSRGQAIAFRSATQKSLGEAGKIIAALPGDRVMVRNLVLYLNGRETVRLNTCENTYNARFCADREYVVASDEVFVLAPHKHSFDSRYWGPIKRAEITGVIAPLASLWKNEEIMMPELVAKPAGAS